MPTSSQALTKRSADNMLMPPPPPPKRIKRPAEILDEDTYTDALSHIIARDFFPGLVETRSQEEYLDALDSRDPIWIARASHRLTEVMTPGPNGRMARGRRGTSLTPLFPTASTFPGDTPTGWAGATPVSTVTSVTTQTTEVHSEGKSVDFNMSLTSFQAKYTSEDNESFNALLDKQNTKRAQKYSWLWAGNKIPTARQILQRQREQKLLTEKGEISSSSSRTSLESDTRPAKPDAWDSNPSNSLMFLPSSIDESTSLPTVQQVAEQNSRAGPKAVVYENTRISLSNSSSTRPTSPTLSAVQSAIAGHPRRAPSSIVPGSATPRVNGYSYVDTEEQSPPPSRVSNISLPSGSTSHPFKIVAASRRENLRDKLVEKAAKRKRQRIIDRTPVLGLGTPRWGRGRSTREGLTPAAERLLRSVGTPMRKNGGFGEGGVDWSTPRIKK